MRFSLKQILLLFLLLGIIGGLFSAALRMPAPYRLETLIASPDGKWLCGGTNNHWFLFDLERGEQVQSNGMKSSFAFQFGRSPVAFLNEDEILFSERVFGMARSLGVWSIKQRELIREQERIATSIALFGTEATDVGPNLVASLTTGDNMRTGTGLLSYVSIFEREGMDRVPIQLVLPYELSSVSVNSSGDLLAMGCRNGEPSRVWDLNSNKQVHEWDERVIQVQYSPTAPQLLVAQRNRLSMRSADGTSDLWELDTKVRTDELSLRYSNDGKRIVFQAGYQEPLKVLNADDGSLITEVDLGRFSRVYEQTPMALSNDGSRLYVAGKRADYGIAVYDTNSGQLVGRLGPVNRFLTAAVFALLFAGWPVAWRWFGTEERELTKNELSIPSVPEVDIFQDANGVASQVKSVKLMMIVGGLFALGFAIIPMFYFSVGLGVAYGWFQIFWAGVGAIGGVFTITRGLGKSNRFLRTAAAVQILNLVNLDIVNALLGIIETIKLNRSDVYRFLRL